MRSKLTAKIRQQRLLSPSPLRRQFWCPQNATLVCVCGCSSLHPHTTITMKAQSPEMHALATATLTCKNSPCESRSSRISCAFSVLASSKSLFRASISRAFSDNSSRSCCARASAGRVVHWARDPGPELESICTSNPHPAAWNCVTSR